MTNTFKSAVLAASAILAVGLTGTAANAQSANGSATANIVGALTILPVPATSLNFGTIVPAAAGGTVTVDTAGSRTCGAGNTCYGTTDAQDFTVTGTAGQTVVVGGATTVTLTGAGADMNVNLSENAAGVGNTFVLPVGGSYTLSYGGSLAIGASQAPGVYGGTFNVTVAYQ